MSIKHEERIDKYIIATAILHNIAILENDPVPNLDPNVHIPPEPAEPVNDLQNIHVNQIPQAGNQDRLAVRRNLIQTYFPDLIRNNRQ